MQGYQALREGAAWLELSGRGRIRATGDDRVRLLHAMCSNHIERLQPGEGCYAFFLNPQGRILADAVILALPDALWIGTEPETRHSLYAHLDKYIIADDVTLEDTTDETAEVGVEGPSSAEVLAKLGAPIPAAPYSHENWGDCLVVSFSTTGQPGFSIVAPAATRDALVRDLEASGAVPASAQDARVVRLELGRPRYGEDITDRWLPHETQVLSAVHFNKGCYIGQEIVERIRSRGGVHRQLAPLEIESEVPPPPGAKILLGENEVGEVTSAAHSPARGRVVALGYLRLGEIPRGAALSVAGHPAFITARKPLACPSHAGS
jgi:folate-binding protein YgfZ